MPWKKSIIVVASVVVLALAGLTAYAVGHEPLPLTGASLSASPAAQAYAESEARLLATRGLVARRHDFAIPDPPMRVHAFEIDGTGVPIVFLHGGGSSAIQWIPLIPGLNGHRLIFVDRPGCGLSDGFDYSGVNLRRHATAFIGSVLDALAIDRAVIVGNSMGGLWGIYYSIDYPHRVAALALLGTPAVTMGTGVPAALRLLATPGIGQLMTLHQPDAATARERMAKVIGRHAVDRIPPDILEGSLLGANIPGATRSFRSLVRVAMGEGVAPSTAEIAGLKPAVLWIWGDSDVFADRGFPSRVRVTLPSSKVVVVTGAGHCPWVDEPHTVGHSLQTFLHDLQLRVEG